MREKRYAVCGFAESDDQPATWEQGDEVVIPFQVHTLTAKNLQEFYAKIFDIRKLMSGQNEVSVFSENSRKSKKPLGDHAYLDWPRLKIDAGES